MNYTTIFVMKLFKSEKYGVPYAGEGILSFQDAGYTFYQVKAKGKFS